MSVDKHTYGIVGYDLTDIKDNLLTEELCESEKYEKFTCFHREGRTQAFDDPMSGNYLYFGYIFFKTDDEWEDVMSSISLEEANIKQSEIENKFEECFGYAPDRKPQIIVFNEYT